ncbi:MAG TPA: hypothetical protein VGG41_07000 [Solirubrobacteraceae bacterium]
MNATLNPKLSRLERKEAQRLRAKITHRESLIVAATAELDGLRDELEVLERAGATPEQDR